MPSKHYEHMDACAKCDEEWPCRDQLFDDIDRLTAALAARDAENRRLREVGDALLAAGIGLHLYVIRDKTQKLKGDAYFDNLEDGLAAANAHRDAEKAWRALLAPVADAGADLPPMSPPAAYPATLEITDVRAGRPLPPDADDTRAAREEGS